MGISITFSTACTIGTSGLAEETRGHAANLKACCVMNSIQLFQKNIGKNALYLQKYYPVGPMTL